MRLKDAALYGLAGLLVLASIPLYGLIFAYAVRSPDDPARKAPAPVPETPRIIAEAPPSRRMLLVEPMPGMRCYGQAAVFIKGNVYTQAVGPDGHPLQCVEGKLLVPAR